MKSCVERLKREIAAQEAEDAARADEAREKARADAEKRRMVAAKFDDAFRAFSVETPQARDDEVSRSVSTPPVLAVAAQAA